MNKKIKNAEVTSYEGIKFRSLTEKNSYVLLKAEKDFEVAYEQAHFTIFEGIRPTVPFWRSTKHKPFKSDSAKLVSITYPPDFIVRYKEVFAIIEIKGFPNDVYPVKRKMFRAFLEKLKNEQPSLHFIFFEIKTLRELKKAIEIIKDASKDA